MKLFKVLILTCAIMLGSSSAAYAETIGDLDGDGKVTSSDYQLMKQYLVGEITSFPIEAAIIDYVNDIDTHAKIGEAFQLPWEVTAKMKDGSDKAVAVKWITNNVDTTKPGEYNFTGVVVGYDKSVNLRLIVDNTIINVSMDSVETQVGSNYTLPTEIEVNYGDGTKGKLPITWDKSIDTSTEGAYTFIGKVEGYSKDVVLTVVVKQQEKRGNSQGNLNNAGYFAEAEDAMIYYAHPLDSYKLYKKSNDGYGSKLSDDSAQNINVYEGWLYYRNNSDGGKAYKIKTDGTERTKLTLEEANHINVVDGWLYYINSYNTIYRIKLDNLLKEKIVDSVTDARFLTISNGWVYYNGNRTFCKTSVDEKNTVVINNDYVLSAIIDGDDIYYEYAAGHFRGDLVWLQQDGTKTTINNGYSDGFNIYNSKLYYLENTGLYSKVYSMNKDGSNTDDIYFSDKESNTLNIVNDKILFQSYTPNIWKSMDLDGGNLINYGDDRIPVSVEERIASVNINEPIKADYVTALMNDGFAGTVKVKWDNLSFDTSALGSNDYYGSVLNYDLRTELTVNVVQNGNTNTNIANGGMVVSDGEWIYYSTNNSIYREKKDGTVKDVIVNVRGAWLNLYKGYLYYVGYSSPDEPSGSMNRINLENLQTERLCNDTTTNLIISNDEIYYFKMGGYWGTSKQLYKRNLDGSNPVQLSTHWCNGFSIYGQWIYYYDTDARGIYRVKSDGTNGEQVYSQSNDGDGGIGLKIYGNELYFQDSRYGNYTLSGMGYYKINLLSNIIYRVDSDTSVSNANMHKGYAYFSNGAGIYKLNLETKEKEIVIDGSISSINIVDDWIYYVINNDLYKIKIDGTENQKVVQ